MADARPAFLFDGALCTGCEACRVACGIANAGGADTGWRTIHTFNPQRHPALPTSHLSLACSHCDTPACLLGCPAAAYSRDPATGAVLLDQERCIGCRYCSWVCPYDAPRFDSVLGVMSKCTFCSERLAAGGQPACTQACPTSALRFGTRPPTAGEPVHVALPATGLGPSLVVEAPRRAGPVPVAPPPVAATPPYQPRPPRKIRPGDEWTLIVFTLVLPLLVAWLAAGLLRPERRPPLIAFLLVGGAAMALSALHLGRPLRASRAVSNLRSSWLSREILLSGLFLTFGAASLLPSDGTFDWLPPVALALGAAALFAVDRVYAAVPRSRSVTLPHSAGALLTGAFLLAVATGSVAAATGFAVLKAVLFLLRRPRLPLPVAAARLALLGAAAAATRLPTLGWTAAVALVLAGELIDRIAFYAELEPASPAATMVVSTSRPV